MFGLDPLDAPFRGIRAVGCAEFLPFRDGYFDTLVFATSLDHVCSLETTIAEARRVLRPSGRLIVWMGDRSSMRAPLHLRLARTLRASLQRRPPRPDSRHGRYSIYPDLTVLYVPEGAVDPFHSYNENPETVTQAMRSGGFERLDLARRTKDEVFLTFA